MDSFVEGIATAVLARIKPSLDAAMLRPRLLTVTQAGVYVGRTPNAVRVLLCRGAFPSVKTDGRVMVDVQDLDR